MDKIKDDGKIERETNLDHRGPSQIRTDWHIPDPPTFYCRLPLKSLYAQSSPKFLMWHAGTGFFLEDNRDRHVKIRKCKLGFEMEQYQVFQKAPFQVTIQVKWG